MCEHGDHVNVHCPAGFSGHNKQRTYLPVDRCIAPLVQALNDAGFLTVCSCCGHGKTTGRITLEDGQELELHPDRAAFERAARIIEAAERWAECWSDDAAPDDLDADLLDAVRGEPNSEVYRALRELDR